MAFAALQSGEKLDRKQKFESDKFDRETRAKAARAVLDELKPSEPYLAELSAASQRPYARYQVNYDLENPWGILLPHLAGIKTVCQRLQLRACASLAAGQSEAALADVKLMLYLGDSIRDEFFLISYLVRLAILQQAAQPIWEGLAEHRWAEAQLQELQTRLLEYDLLTDMKHPLEGERAAGILTAELLSRQKCQLSNLLGDANPSSSALADLLGRIAPHGWYYLEQLNYCRFYEQQLGGTFDREKRRIFPAQIASHAHEFEREIGGGRLGKGAHAALHHRFLATLLLPSLGKVTIKTAMVQTALDQAALACALERYRLANGRFPENLDALQARFLAQLPHDLITGEPYRYRRTDDGQFLLHSVGWDEKDDGGVPGKVLFDDKRGDWVWQYPSR